MPEDIIDGSNLELTDQSSTQAETVEQVQTASPEPQPSQEPQPPKIDIPEQYRNQAQGMTADQIAYELWKKDSALGRHKAELSNLRQQVRTVPQTVYNQQTPSPLPGEVSGQRYNGQPQENLDEKYFETPSKVIEQIVRKEVSAGIQSYEQLQQQRQQQAVMGRAQWISSIDDDELSNLRLEDGFTADHEALMESIAKRDPEVISKLRNPNLTEHDVREAVRTLYAKADKILKGQLQDPEKIKALNIAQKQAAANGAPATRASTSTGATSDQLPESASNYKFLFGG